MYEGKVVRAFICRHSRRVHNPQDTYRNQDLERMKELAGLGYIQFDGPKTGQSQDSDPGNGGAVPNSDAGQDQDPRMKHVGGGYYELPDGTKVQGKEAALEALKATEPKE